MNDSSKPTAPERDCSVPRLHTVADVMAILQLGDAKVRELIHSGQLPAFRLGAEWRVVTHDLQEFLDARRTAVATSSSDPEVRQ